MSVPTTITFPVEYGLGLRIWQHAETKDKLRQLSQADKKIQWIKTDLTLQTRSTLANLFWKIFGIFEFVRNKFFDISLNKSKSILYQLKSEVTKHDLELQKLFNSAASKFNQIAPRHQVALINLVEPIAEQAPALQGYEDDSAFGLLNQSYYESEKTPIPAAPATQTNPPLLGQLRKSAQFGSPIKAPRNDTPLAGRSKIVGVPQELGKVKIGSTDLIFMKGNIAEDKLGKVGSAIVNAANVRLGEGSGVNEAIHAAAGSSKLKEACAAIIAQRGNLKESECEATPAFQLDAQFIIHSVGPNIETVSYQKILEDTFTHVLQKAQSLGVKKIALPAIGIGAFRIKADKAAPITMKAIKDFLIQNPTAFIEVHLVFANNETAALYQASLA